MYQYEKTKTNLYVYFIKEKKNDNMQNITSEEENDEYHTNPSGGNAQPSGGNAQQICSYDKRF